MNFMSLGKCRMSEENESGFVAASAAQCDLAYRHRYLVSTPRIWRYRLIGDLARSASQMSNSATIERTALWSVTGSGTAGPGR